MSARSNGSIKEQEAAMSCGYILRKKIAHEILVDDDESSRRIPDCRGIHGGGYIEPTYTADIRLAGLTNGQVRELVAWVSGRADPAETEGE